MSSPASPPDAHADLRFIHDVLARTEQRIDPHAFHFVNWGALVLVGYPLLTLLERHGRHDLMLPVGLAFLAVGVLLGWQREARLARRPRLEGGNTFVEHQVMIASMVNVAIGVLVSVFWPALGLLAGAKVPVAWGLLYANLAFMLGLVYRREFLVSAGAIFAACWVALLLPGWEGLVLGPAMGLGMLVPGLMAERRVWALARETVGA